MSKIGKNIKKIRSIKSLSQQEFGEIFGLKRATLGAYEEERSEPKLETVINMANYFGIPIDDLLTKDLTVNQIAKFKSEITTATEQIDVNHLAKIPLISEHDRDKYLGSYENKNPLQLPKLHLPLNPEKDFKALEVVGLEMSSEIGGLYPKDIVIGEKVPKSAFKKLNSNTLVFVHNGKQMLLRKYYATQSQLLLKAEHQGIEDTQWAWKEVKEMWRVRYIFYRRVPNETAHSLLTKLNELEAKVNEMSGKES